MRVESGPIRSEASCLDSSTNDARDKERPMGKGGGKSGSGGKGASGGKGNSGSGSKGENPNYPSTTGNPSGGGRGNTPKSK